MRLSEGAEGGISNFERMIDGFLAGLPYDALLPGLRKGQRQPARAADRRPRVLRLLTRRTPTSRKVSSAPSPTYTQALDDGRTDDVVATYCPDGGCDIPGLGTLQGHDGATRGLRSGWSRAGRNATSCSTR